MLEVLCFILTCLLKLIVFFILFVIFCAIVIKLWVEPFKGFCKCRTKLDNKVVLVTGGNSGIGLETARDLAKRGARVIIASSNDQKSKVAVKDIIKTTGNKNVEYKHLDLSKFRSVRDFVEDFNRTVDRLDILVNNSGCAVAEDTTEDGNNMVMQINYLGPFLLTSLLVDKLIESKPSRIIIVSSYAHKFPYFDPEDLSGLNYIFCCSWFRYANSKLCNVLWTKALSKKLPEGVTVNCLHPGIVESGLFRNLHPILENMVLAILNVLFKTPQEGAQTTMHLCVCPDLDNVSGEYFADCKISSMSRKARNNKLAEKVWNYSIRLIKQK